MSTACQIDYTLTVNSAITVDAYWTLNEAAGSVDRVDSVDSRPLKPTGVTDAGVAALISNGVSFTAAFGGSGYDTSLTPIAYTSGNSFSAWGWIRVNATGVSSAFGGPLFSFFMSAFHQIYVAGGSSTDPQPFRVSTESDDAYINLTLNAWHMFHIFFDKTVNKYGYSFDAGAEVLLPTVVALPTANNSYCQLNQNYLGGTGETLFDEIGLSITAKLTAGQVNHLYNGGAGRTWPL